MATNLHLDDALIQRALELGSHSSKRETVNAALAAYVAELERKQALTSFGTFEFDDDFDYKRARRAS